MSDLTATLGIPTVTPETRADGTSVIHVAFNATNTSSRRIEDNEIKAMIWATAQDGTAESAAQLEYELTGLDVLASGDHHAPLQVDPGTWNVGVYLFESKTADEITRSDPQSVHVAGAQSHQAAFTENAAYALSVQITSVERVAGSVVRVHYNLTNTGKVAVPPGLEVYGYVDNEVKHAESNQDYHLMHGVAVGATDAHYLTLEGATDAGTSWLTSIWVDPNGPSSAWSSVNVTWDANGHAAITAA